MNRYEETSSFQIRNWLMIYMGCKLINHYIMSEEKIKARKRKQETSGVVCIPILHRPEVEIFQPGSSLKGLGFSLKLSAWPSSHRGGYHGRVWVGPFRYRTEGGAGGETGCISGVLEALQCTQWGARRPGVLQLKDVRYGSDGDRPGYGPHSLFRDLACRRTNS